jgi:hypothetical protein
MKYILPSLDHIYMILYIYLYKHTVSIHMLKYNYMYVSNNCPTTVHWCTYISLNKKIKLILKRKGRVKMYIICSHNWEHFVNMKHLLGIMKDRKLLSINYLLEMLFLLWHITWFLELKTTLFLLKNIVWYRKKVNN